MVKTILALVLLLTAALGYIIYDTLGHKSASNRASISIKRDSITLVAVRDSVSTLRTEKEGISRTNESLIRKYSKFTLTTRTHISRSDTVYTGDTVRITNTDTVEVVPQEVKEHISQADSIIANYARSDSLQSRIDSLHHEEIKNLERQISNLKTSVAQEISKRNRQGIRDKLVFTTVGALTCAALKPCKNLFTF